MSRREHITKELLVEPGTAANIAGRDPAWTGGPEFFLNVSKREQKRRFLARLDEPGKQWRFSAADLAERARWDDYMRAFEEAITARKLAAEPEDDTG
jgi:hypothetical protein